MFVRLISDRFWDRGEDIVDVGFSVFEKIEIAPVTQGEDQFF
jgi:hypothetical protein